MGFIQKLADFMKPEFARKPYTRSDSMRARSNSPFGSFSADIPSFKYSDQPMYTSWHIPMAYVKLQHGQTSVEIPYYVGDERAEREAYEKAEQWIEWLTKVRGSTEDRPMERRGEEGDGRSEEEGRSSKRINEKADAGTDE